jgi:hypothetical protein
MDIPCAKLAAAYELLKNGTMISGNVGAIKPIGKQHKHEQQVERCEVGRRAN